MITAILILAATLATEPRVTTWNVPEKQIPTELVRHGDALWFVSWKDWPKIHANLGRIDTKGKFTMTDVPVEHMPGITARSRDGVLWLSDARKPVLWRVSRDGKVTQVKTKGTTQGIAVGPDGNLWTTHHQSASITQFGTDGAQKGVWEVAGTKKSQPLWIVPGPDGALWFTERDERRIGRISTTGELKTYPLPPMFGVPMQIIPGPDGALWFSLSNTFLGRITTTGALTTEKIGIRATWLATDSEGRLWYTDGVRVGYLDSTRKPREFEVKGAKNIRALAEGADGAMWFADQVALTIGRIEVD